MLNWQLNFPVLSRMGVSKIQTKLNLDKIAFIEQLGCGLKIYTCYINVWL